MTELIKCECGKEPKIMTRYNAIYRRQEYWLECEDCQDDTRVYKTEAEAIEAWNRRGEELWKYLH